jgi:rubrerythrin
MSRHDAGPNAGRATPSGASPVDDHTYNILQALTSTLEALDAYEVYAQDEPDGVFSELILDERRHAERLLDELRTCLLQPVSR